MDDSRVKSFFTYHKLLFQLSGAGILLLVLSIFVIQRRKRKINKLQARKTCLETGTFKDRSRVMHPAAIASSLSFSSTSSLGELQDPEFQNQDTIKDLDH